MKKILKRSLSVLLAIAIVFSSAYVGLGELDFGWFDFSKLFTVKAEAADSGTCGENVKWNLDSNGTLTISGSGPMSDATWAISPWRAYSSSIKSVIITNGVTRIGNSSFFNLSYISSVTIPDSVTSIGEDAFTRCSKITSIALPDNLQTIESWAFSECSGLTSIVIPDSVTKLGKLAFSYCTGLSSIKLSDNLTSIERATFNECSSLKSITIPDSVTSIGEVAFAGCKGLTSISIPDKVTSIGYAPFQGCTNISEINISENNVACVFDDGALFNKAKTKLIQCFEDNDTYTIPDSVTDIGEYAFYNCTNLVSIKIPTSVLNIEYYAFGTCKNLKYVFYKGLENDWSNILIDKNTPLTNAVIHYNSTDHTYSDWVIDVEPTCNVVGQKSHSCSVCNYKETVKTATSHYYSNGLCKNCGVAQEFTYTVENNTVTITGYTGTSTDVVIPSLIDGLPVTHLSVLYSSSAQIKTITIPESITTIASKAFSRCKYLEKVYWNAKNVADFSSRSDVFYNAGINGAGIEFVFGDTVEKIPAYLCYVFDLSGLPLIKSVIIGNNVTDIGVYAFGDCGNLLSVEFGSGLKDIGDYAFRCCNKLTYLTIPGNVTRIGEGAFYRCEGLESVVIQDGVKIIEMDAFYGCRNLNSITLPDSVTYIGKYAFLSTKYYGTYNNYEDNLLYIGNYLIGVRSSSYITSYRIKDGTKIIANNIFELGSHIKSVTIPATVTHIGDSVFIGCKGLTSIKIPSSVTHIGKETFLGCTGLTSIIIPDKVTSIDNGAFSECTSLTTVVIPDSITSIGVSAFSNCSSLKYTFYCGSESDWANITIGKYNTPLTNAAIHFNATDHTYQDVNFAPTCTEDGGKGKECVVCGCTLDYETIPATGHQTTEWITEQEPNCTEAGYKDEWCLDCGELINTEELPATGHQITEWITEQEPNCTEAGYKDEWCLDCGELINTEEIPELGHSYGEWIIDTEPTCTEDGSKHQICSVCGDVNTEIILSKGHSFSIEWTIDVAPTCTEEGSKSHHCTACEEITDVTVVEALGHTYSTEWTIDVKATCTEEGCKSHHCVDCDNAKADITVIAPLGHNFRAISVSNEHPHIILSECSRCPETKEEESYSEKCGVCNFTYTENADGTCKITAYTGSSDTLIIPATINGKTVATTNTGAFKNNTTLTSVKIENGVQGIGSLAFIGCSSLSEVVIPESVTNIGSKAFYNCSSDLTIYCYSGSYAMQYAIDNSLNYEIINIGETDNCTIDYDNKIIFANDTFTTGLDEIADLPSNAEVSVQGSFISGSAEIFGTGSKVTITDGDSSFEYTLVINGDLNGDGTCDVIDASLAYLYSVDMEEASEIEIIAANGCVSDELDANSYQNVVNMCLA